MRDALRDRGHDPRRDDDLSIDDDRQTLADTSCGHTRQLCRSIMSEGDLQRTAAVWQVHGRDRGDVAAQKNHLGMHVLHRLQRGNVDGLEASPRLILEQMKLRHRPLRAGGHGEQNKQGDRQQRFHTACSLAMTSVWSSFCGASPTKASTEAAMRSRSSAAESEPASRRMASRRSFSNSSPASFSASVMPSLYSTTVDPGGKGRICVMYFDVPRMPIGRPCDRSISKLPSSCTT